MIEIKSIPIFTDNYVHTIISGNQCAVVDPGDAQPVIEYLEKNNLKLSSVIITHHHNDHIGGLIKLKEKYNCHVVGPSYDKHRIAGINQYLTDGDTYTIFGEEATILHTPGHTLGHICYYFKNLKTLFCGDTLFSMGCGYLFEGTAKQMWESLSKLKKLPHDTKVYCTHEYTLSNLEFALSIDNENKELNQYQENIKTLRSSNQFSVPSMLSDELKLNPFLRASDQNFKALLGKTGMTDAEFFGHIRELKNQF